MSSKVNKTKLTKKIKPTKANNEIRKTKDTKATNISTTHKTMKKNTRQSNKPHQPPSNQKYVETNNDKIIHEKKRSASAKKPNSKESTVKPTRTNSKSNSMKKPRSQSVNAKLSKTNIPTRITPTTRRASLTKTSSYPLPDPTPLSPPLDLKTKSESNFDISIHSNRPILRTKLVIPETNTREGRKKIAKETMKILFGADSGKYVIKQHTVNLSEKIVNCVKNSETIINVRYDTWDPPIENDTNCQIEVTSEASFTAAKRLSFKYKTCVVNAGSGTTPGGGFIHGKANEQETSLSRQSALFKCLKKEKFLYLHHKVNKTNFKYTDYMIYSPEVPVFRDGKTEKLLNESEVFLTDIVTVAPPNKNLMIQNKQKLDELGDVIYNRCEKLLRCLIDHGVKAAVFGAFGCGACGNDPKEVSAILRDLIIRKGYGRFLDVVVFAVGDGDDAGGKSKNFQQFKKTFRV